MAEALLRRYAGEHFEAYSAGFVPMGIHPYTVRVMQEIGEDLDGQLAKSVRTYMGKTHFGYVITVCDVAEEKCPNVFPDVAHHLHWPFEDPAASGGSDGVKLQRFRQARDQIDKRIRDWLSEKGIVVGS
jgi:arsenate reductase